MPFSPAHASVAFAPRPAACARRRPVSARFAWALLLIAAVGGDPARAEEVPFQVTGEVLTVLPANQTAANALAAAGVVEGAQATVAFTIESTTPASEEDPFSFYPEAIVAMTVQVGSYLAMLDPPPGFESLILVQVGDNEPGGLPLADSYLLSTPGTDGMLLHSAVNSVTLFASFFHNGGAAGSDQSVIQDPFAYEIGTAQVGGLNGSITIRLHIGNGGGGPGVGPGFCQKRQLLAGAKLSRSALKCMGKRAQQPPEKDPEGEKQAACIAKAAGKFAQQFAAAVAKTMKKGGVCALPGTEQQNAADALVGSAETLGAELLTEVDTADKNDRVLRGKLFKAAAAQCGKDMAAHAKDVFKPSPDKLGKKLAASRAATVKKADKAIAVAGNKGVTYTGPTASEIADSVTAIVDGFVALTAGMAPPAVDVTP